jgi:hypothetical protein
MRSVQIDPACFLSGDIRLNLQRIINPVYQVGESNYHSRKNCSNNFVLAVKLS